MFSFRKGVTVETQLAELAACGIELEPGISVEDVILGGGLYFFNDPPQMKKLRRTLETDPYDTIILCLGGEVVMAGNEITPLTRQLFHWDCERVHDPAAYAEVVTRLEHMSGCALELTEITGDVDLEDGKFAYVQFQRAGETVRWDFDVDGDWMQTAVFDHYNELLRAAAPHLRLYYSVLGQDWMLAILTEDQFAQFQKLSRVKFDPY